MIGQILADATYRDAILGGFIGIGVYVVILAMVIYLSR